MTRLRWAVFLAIAGLVAYLCVAILRPFANVLTWSVVLAIVCYPLRQRLVRQTGRAALSAFITSVVTVVAIVVPLLLLAGVAVNECIEAVRWWRESGQHANEPLMRVAEWLSQITRPFGIRETAINAWIQQHITTAATTAGGYAVTFATDLFGGVVSSALVIFATFLLLRDGSRLVAAMTELLPFERNRSEALLVRIKDVVQASVYGVVVIALLQGALCGAMFALLGIPAAAFWGAVTVFASVLPVVGSFAIWGPATAYLALTGHLWQAAVLAAWGTFVVSGIDNLLRPRLVAGRVGLNELATFFSLLGGLAVFGGVGIVLGPVVFATASALVDELRTTKES